MIKKIVLFCLILSLVLLVSCSFWSKETDKGVAESKIKKTTTKVSSEKIAPQTHTIFIENNKFKPIDLDIKIGDTVVWINKDSIKHTVTFEDVRVDQVLTNSAKVSHTFKEKEEARYFCKFHPGMTGSVKVS